MNTSPNMARSVSKKFYYEDLDGLVINDHQTILSQYYDPIIMILLTSYINFVFADCIYVVFNSMFMMYIIM